MGLAEMPAAERPLRVLTIEDRVAGISGTLDALDYDGHCVEHHEHVVSAAPALRTKDFDFLILDESLPKMSGSDIVIALKQGRFGMRNVDVPFMFVTGNPDWIERAKMEVLEGFLGVERKATNLTPRLFARVELVRRSPPLPGRSRLRRVICRVAGPHDGAPQLVDLHVPSWRPTPLPVALTDLPGAVYLPMDHLRDRHYFAWMNLDATTAEETQITHFEPDDVSEPEEEQDAGPC